MSSLLYGAKHLPINIAFTLFVYPIFSILGNEGCNGRFVSHLWCQSRNTIETNTIVQRLVMQSIAEVELPRVVTLDKG